MAFEDFPKAGRTQIIVYVIKLAICVVAVGIRFCCKLSRVGEKKRQIKWDDFWILVALSLTITESSLAIWGTVESKGGLPAPVLIQTGNLQGAENFLKSTYLGSVFWYVAEACICASILCLYLTVFEHQSHIRLQVNTLFVLTAMWGLGAGFAGVFLCDTPSNWWKMKDLEKCRPFMPYILGTSVSQIILMALIFAVPIRPILTLTMDTQKKLGIIGIFLLGSFVIISAIVRLALVYDPDSPAPDFYLYILWSSIHTTAAYVCSTLPLSRPLWRGVSGSLQSLTSFSNLIFKRSSTSQKSGDIALDRPSESSKEQIVAYKRSTGDYKRLNWQ